MNKDEFINCIISMYPKSFTENNINTWREVYSQLFPESLDFDDLFDWFLVNYSNSAIAPGTGVFKPYLEKHERDRQEKIKQKQQRDMQEGMKRLKQEIDTFEKETVAYDLLEPLDLLKTLYSDQKAFVKSMQERQNSLPRFMKKGFVFFLNEELREFRHYVNSLPNEKLKIMFWRKCAKIIGSEDKYNELCRDL